MIFHCYQKYTLNKLLSTGTSWLILLISKCENLGLDLFVAPLFIGPLFIGPLFIGPLFIGRL